MRLAFSSDAALVSPNLFGESLCETETVAGSIGRLFLHRRVGEIAKDLDELDFAKGSLVGSGEISAG